MGSSIRKSLGVGKDGEELGYRRGSIYWFAGENWSSGAPQLLRQQKKITSEKKRSKWCCHSKGWLLQSRGVRVRGKGRKGKEIFTSRSKATGKKFPGCCVFTSCLTFP